MSDKIPLDELQRGLSQLVGLERADELVKEALRANGLEPKRGYTREEIREICNALKANGGMIGVVVSAIAVRLLTG